MFPDTAKAEIIQEILIGILQAVTKRAQAEVQHHRKAEQETIRRLFPH